MNSPTFCLIASPNGSGKSTLCASQTFRRFVARHNMALINPDEILPSSQDTRWKLTDVGRRIHDEINDLIERRMSIAVETTLSGKTYIGTLRRCRSAGYYLVLHFIFVSDVESAMDRVKTRVATGGHDVPLADQIRRFDRSLLHSIEAAKIADEAYFYDNSGRHGPRVVASKIGNTINIAGFAPRWLLAADFA